MGKIVSVYEHFGLRTFQFTNDLQERINFVNRGLTVQRNTEARSWHYFLQRKSRFMYFESVFVAVGMQHAKAHARYCHL